MVLLGDCNLDVLGLISLNLDYISLLRLSQCAKIFRTIIKKDYFWCRKLVYEFDYPANLIGQGSMCYREIYHRKHYIETYKGYLFQFALIKKLYNERNPKYMDLFENILETIETSKMRRHIRRLKDTLNYGGTGSVFDSLKKVKLQQFKTKYERLFPILFYNRILKNRLVNDYELILDRQIISKDRIKDAFPKIHYIATTSYKQDKQLESFLSKKYNDLNKLKSIVGMIEDGQDLKWKIHDLVLDNHYRKYLIVSTKEMKRILKFV